MIRICTNINTWKVICIDNWQGLCLCHVRSFFFVTKQKRKVIKNSILPTHSTILKRPLMLFRYPVLRFILIKRSTNSEMTQLSTKWKHSCSHALTQQEQTTRLWDSWRPPVAESPPCTPPGHTTSPRPRLYTANVRLDSCQAEYVDVDVRDRENVKSNLLIYFLLSWWNDEWEDHISLFLWNACYR